MRRPFKSMLKNGKPKWADMEWSFFCIQIVPYLVVWYVCNKLSYGYYTYPAKDVFGRLVGSISNMTGFKSPMPSLYPEDVLIGLIGCGAFFCLRYIKSMDRKKLRSGVEQGSAKWGTRKDILPYMDTHNPTNNILLSSSEGLLMNGRPKLPKYARNKNVLIIGGSGSGKTRFYVKPNLMQMHSSYVVTDPKGTLIGECGSMLVENGYVIKVLNTINFTKSSHYNPFAYIRSEKDILKLVNTLVLNTKGEGDKAGEDFWVKAEKLYYTALITLIWYVAPPEEQNFSMLIDLLDASETSEDDEDFKNAVDLLFDDLEQERPGNFANRQYAKYKLAAGKTAKSILISCAARLAPFDIPQLRDLTNRDDLELGYLGERKTALFVIISDTDSTFNFLVSIMFSQMFNLLCDKADDVYGGRLPIHVRCILDEFANIGQIPGMDKLIATIRSREISASIILQTKTQLKTLYKDSAETIEGNCDTRLFLGGWEQTTIKDMTEVLGKETIDIANTSNSKGASPSSSVSYQKTGRELMTPDEIAVMDGGKCIVQIRGVRPFFSDKYDILTHPQYGKLSDYDKQNAFDVVAYLAKDIMGEMALSNEQKIDLYFDAGEV